MKLEQLSGLMILLEVAERKSFSDAARALGVSPSAVSQAIRQLEFRLGVALLARTTRSVRLTEVGEKFLARCEPGLREVMASVDQVSEMAETPAGTLRISLPRVAFTPIFEPILSRFLETYPEISLDLSFEDDLVDIVEGGFDAGIRLSETVARDMTVVRVYPSFRFLAAGSPRYLKRNGEPREIRDLLKHECIRFRFSDGEIYDKWEFEQGGKETSVQVRGRLIVNDAHVMLQAGLAGAGLIYHSEHVLAPYLKEGSLKPVLERFSTRTDGYFLYFPNRNQVLPKLRAFLDFLKKKA